MKLIFRWICYLFCMAMAAVGVGAASLLLVLYFLSAELPDHNSVKKYSPDVASRVFLQDGSKLCEYASERRYFIPVDRIPQKLIAAFVAAEDKHFFEHAGVDFLGILRSLVRNLENIGTGKRPQGASTITQQVARLFLIKNSKISYIRKIKEAILSFRIESVLSKAQILELYLNHIYLGLGAYGVAAAANVYFDKTVDELTISECSYLASLAKGANNYHPIKHREKAISRRNWAIQRQLDDGYITPREAQEAMSENLNIVRQPPRETAEYFAEEIRKYLIEKFSFESLNKEGLIVRGTLDARLQKCARDALKRGLEKTDRGFGWRGPIGRVDVGKNPTVIADELRKIDSPAGCEDFTRAVVLSVGRRGVATLLTDGGERGNLAEGDKKWAGKISAGDVILVKKSENSKGIFSLKQFPRVQGAIVVVEVDTGRILAMQGGYSFRHSEFNRTTQAMRQIGSAFKPFVYLAGLENGFAPNSIIDASPIEIDLGEKLGVWKPKNYMGKILDNVVFRRALERSINTATVRIAQEVGLDKIAKIARQFGVFENMPQLISYALGAGETTLLKLTTAYAMLANGGRRISPTMVDYVQDKLGNVIFKSDQREAVDAADFTAESPPKLNDVRPQILDEQSIYQIVSLLEGVMLRGSGSSAAFLKFPIAGKTGTSNDSRDVWFIGCTPDIAVGVFVGFDDHSKSLGKNASGSSVALPIFIDFMLQAKEYLSPKPFRVPKGINLRKIDAETGESPSKNSKSIILEAFKEDDDSPEIIRIPKKKSSILELFEEKKDEPTAPAAIQPILGVY